MSLFSRLLGHKAHSASDVLSHVERRRFRTRVAKADLPPARVTWSRVSVRSLPRVNLAFIPAVLPAILLCFGSIILTLTLALHEIAGGLGHPGVGIPAEIAAMCVGFLLLLVLLRPSGAIGAAIASIAGYGTALIVLVVLLDRRLGRKVIPALVAKVKDVQTLARRACTILRSRLVDVSQGAA